jgi:hypothetical protein
MANTEQGTPNDEGKNERAFGLEDRLIDVPLPFESPHSLFDIRYYCALVDEH